MALGCAQGVHTGTVWTPSKEVKKANPGADDYMIAVKLGMTMDPLPQSRTHFALVAMDDRPGTLQVHPWTELKVID